MKDFDSTPQPRSEEQIQAELAATRAEMSATVDALVERFQPDYLMGQAKVTAQEKVAQTKAFVAQTIDEARAGDQEALKKVGIAVGCGVALVALIGLRLARRRR
ncbi:DUF3618 domain-containing protein [Schaalia vaccimaxillae]|uniref:DUF3618 domain-containing protein n=1 Tax=Schaalia vaccimaxillae TaxID=183916 RepID=UPI0003B3BBA7|nr:DUF3618 domain-containing protein [Schaalia vaccimaxillae]